MTEIATILLIFKKISTLVSHERSLMVATFRMVEILPEQFKFKLKASEAVVDIMKITHQSMCG